MIITFYIKNNGEVKHNLGGFGEEARFISLMTLKGKTFFLSIPATYYSSMKYRWSEGNDFFQRRIYSPKTTQHN